jgi:hypothetical protein
MGLPAEDESSSQNEADVVSLSSATGSGPLHDHSPAKDAEKELRKKIISKEEVDVRNARAVVIIAGIACAAAVAIAINIFAHQNEQSSFELEVRKSEIIHAYSCVTENHELTQFVFDLPFSTIASLRVSSRWFY